MSSRRQHRKSHPLQSSSFYLLVATIVGMLAFLSIRFNSQWDWAANDRNSLSETSRQVVGQLQAPLTITSFTPEHRELRLRIKSVIAPYQRASTKISLTFVSPSAQPSLTRKLGIRASGELRFEYQGRAENLQNLDEQHITRVIQRLLRREQYWIVGLEGHGERSLLGQGNYDLGLFGGKLKIAGYPISTLNLTDTPTIPDNTQILLLAGPQTGYLPGEISQIERYLKEGGNLLWLAEPGGQYGLEQISKQLGLSLLPGTVVDASGAKLGLESPAILPISNYGEHPATRELNQHSLFPHAMAMESGNSPWKTSPILQSHTKSWNETSPLKGELALNPEAWETPGPLTVGFSLTRKRTTGEQRIIVIGDGDFLSNTYLGNGGNLNLGLNLIRWLAQDDQLLDISAHVASDRAIHLSDTASALIGFLFLFGIPVLLASTGIYLGYRRRGRQ